MPDRMLNFVLLLEQTRKVVVSIGEIRIEFDGAQIHIDRGLGLVQILE
jgi:hypothetical protein